MANSILLTTVVGVENICLTMQVVPNGRINSYFNELTLISLALPTLYRSNHVLNKFIVGSEINKRSKHAILFIRLGYILRKYFQKSYLNYLLII